MDDRQLGFVGLGAMGGGMVKSLLRKSFRVKAFDLRDEARAEAAEFGAEAARSIREAAAGADVVLSSLPNLGDVEAVALGEGGLLGAMRPGSIYIDLSSIDPLTTRKVGAALAERGVRMLDVPVGKGPPAAASGSLTLMIGGDPAVVEECQPILRALGSEQFYCGPLGSGVTVKVINNLVSCSILALNAEAMVLGAKSGLDLDVLAGVMSTTAADSWHLRNAIQTKVLAGDFTARFRLALAHKDLRQAAQYALQLGVPVPLAQAAQFVHAVALADGHGDEDQAACIKPIEKIAGVEARRSTRPS